MTTIGCRRHHRSTTVAVGSDRRSIHRWRSTPPSLRPSTIATIAINSFFKAGDDGNANITAAAGRTAVDRSERPPTSSPVMAIAIGYYHHRDFWFFGPNNYRRRYRSRCDGHRRHHRLRREPVVAIIVRGAYQEQRRQRRISAAITTAFPVAARLKKTAIEANDHRTASTDLVVWLRYGRRRCHRWPRDDDDSNRHRHRLGRRRGNATNTATINLWCGCCPAALRRGLPP